MPTTPSTGSPGARRAGPRQAPRPADLPEHRLRGVSLVPRHGARVVRGRGRRRGYLNDHFVSIKVDREERPDLDQVYMAAVQAMTGGGGWPMSVFLTPDGRPFYGGTYFPDEPRHGMPSFRQVLEGVDRAWRQERAAGRGRRRAARAGPDRAGPDPRPAADDPTAEPARCGDVGDRGVVRSGQRRLGPRAQVPAADDDRVPAPPAPRDRRRPAACDRAPIARRDGRRRDPRPARWRLPSLLDRRRVARSAFRADALRQRPAGAGLRARLAGHRTTRATGTSRSGRSTT